MIKTVPTLIALALLLSNVVITTDMNLKFSSDAILSMKMLNGILFAGRSDGCINSYNISSGSLLRTYKGHSSFVFGVDVDSQNLYSASDDNSIKVWSQRTGFLIRTIDRAHAETIFSIAVDDDYIYSGSQDSVIKRWNKNTGKLSLAMNRHNGAVASLTVSGDYLYSGSNSGELFQWYRPTGSFFKEYVGHKERVLAIAVDGQWIYSGSADRSILKWNNETSQVVATFLGHTTFVYSLAVDEERLISSSTDSTIKIWDKNTTQLLRTLARHKNPVYSIVADGAYVYSGSYDRYIFEWSKITGNVNRVIQETTPILYTIANDKKYVYAGDGSSKIVMWDKDSGDLVNFFKGHNETVNSIALDEEFLYSASSDGFAIQWRKNTGHAEQIYGGHDGEVLALAADEDYLYTSTDIGSIYKRNKTDGSLMFMFANSNPLRILSLAVDGDYLYSGSVDSFVKQWDKETGFLTRILRGHTDAVSCIIVEELYVYSGSSDAKAIRWNKETGTVIREYVGHEFTILSLAVNEFSLYTGSVDQTIIQWNKETGEQIRIISGSSSIIRAITLDENFLYSAREEGVVAKHRTFSGRVETFFLSDDLIVREFCSSANNSFMSFGGQRIVGFDLDLKAVTSCRNIDTQGLAIISQDTSLFKIFKTASSITVEATDSKFPLLQQILVKRTLSVTTSIAKNFGHFEELFFALEDGSIVYFNLYNYEYYDLNWANPVSIQHMFHVWRSLYLYDSAGYLSKVDLEMPSARLNTSVYAPNMHVLSGNSEFLFVGDILGNVFSWPLSSFGKDARILKDGENIAHSDTINAMMATKSYLYTAGNDRRVKQWSLKSFTRVSSFALTWIPYSVFAHNDVLLVGGIEVLAYFNLVHYEQDVATPTMSSKSKTETSAAPVVGGSSVANDIAFPLWQVIVAVAVLLLTLSILTLWLRKKFSAKTTSPKETSPAETSIITSWTSLSTQLQTIVPLSVHAEFKQEPANFVPVKKIAEGGGGKVFICQLMNAPLKAKYGEVVVQKLVQINSRISEDAFNQEVAISIMLSTFPFFVDIVGYTIKPYSIILRYYADGSLFEWIKKSEGRNKTSTLLKIIADIASAIATMHGHFIAHCDLKPQNILIQLKNDVPTCFITDFGIAQVLSDKVVATKMFTIVSLRGLSVFYASPESFQNFRQKDYRKTDYKKYDMYSFASITYEIITRKIQWH